MSVRRIFVLGVAAGLAVGVVLVLALHDHVPTGDECTPVARTPRISPDYADTVIPPNIAPLNFVVREPGKRYCVRIWAETGPVIDLFSRSGRVVIPPASWKTLLEANRGRTLTFDVHVRDDTGRWRRFAPVVNTIATEEIDPCLVYRKMPVYGLSWREMGIYERDLRTSRERVVLHIRSFGYGCVNCHTFAGGRPGKMLLNVRSPAGGRPPGGMLMADDGRGTRVVDTTTPFNVLPATYLAWHPSGRAVAFSTNKVLQCFHTVGEHRDVVDSFSDIALYRVDSNTVTTTPAVSKPERLETWPTWSPDGRHLYFCSAPRRPVSEYRSIRYDLMRIACDVAHDTWGEPETVLPADETGLSISLPRFSPDGRFLLFCMCDYGNFPAFRPTSDLYMMDVGTRRYRRLEISSDRADAYHAWSSNGRWIVFSSKRRDGLFARPYFSYVDDGGGAHKPFLLPQEDPAFYDAFLHIYNCPELVAGPVDVTERELARAINSPAVRVRARLDPRVTPREEPGARTKDWWSAPSGHAQ